MKTLVVAGLLASLSLSVFGQKQFVIRGKIELLSKSTHLVMTGYDPVPIRADGSFEIVGEVKEPRSVLIRTDSSGASAIWLEPGEYAIECTEVRLATYKGTLVRCMVLQGPGHAVLYSDFMMKLHHGFDIDGGEGESVEEVRLRRKARSIAYMDSVVKVDNASPVLANMIRMVHALIGDDACKRLIQSLAPSLRGDDQVALLEKGFKRKEKIAAEKVFEDFVLKDTAGKDFSLSSLVGKKAILIDFWASSCGPCRMEHPRLKAWYAKYADRGLAIVSISIDENKGAWLKAIKADGIESWINVCDFTGWKAALLQSYFISYIPFRFLLDGNRTIVTVDNKQDSWISEKDIEKLLNN